MQNSWDLLLQKLGIAKKFYDGAKNRSEYVVDDEVLRKMVNCLGFNLPKIEDSEALLNKINKSRWLYGVEPIYVVRKNNQILDVVLKAEELENLKLNIQTQSSKKNINANYSTKIAEEKNIGKTQYYKVEIKIDSLLEPDYYEINISVNENKYHTILAV